MRRGGILPALVLALLAADARAFPPEYSILPPLLITPFSPGSASPITFEYLIVGDTAVPRFALPTQVALVGDTIVIDVTVESDPGGLIGIGEQQVFGPLAEGNHPWIIRVYDFENDEIDFEQRGEFLVLDDPGPSGSLSLVMDARMIEVTDGDCESLPCSGPTVVSEAPVVEFEAFSEAVSLGIWNSTLASSIQAGEDWATLGATSYTDGFSSPGTGRAVFDVVFDIPQALPYTITGDFEADFSAVGNGLTRFELRRVITGQNFDSIFGLTLEGPFEEMPVNESGTLVAGRYEVLAIGSGCCDGADADWNFDLVIGTPPEPPPPPPAPIPSVSPPGLALLATALAAAGLAAARRRT